MNKIEIAKSLIREAIYEDLEIAKNIKDKAKKFGVGVMIASALAGAPNAQSKPFDAFHEGDQALAKKMHSIVMNKKSAPKKAKKDYYAPLPKGFQERLDKPLRQTAKQSAEEFFHGEKKQ